MQPTKSSPNHETSRRTTFYCQFSVLFHSLITHCFISTTYTQRNKNEWISSTIQKIMDPSSNTLATEIHHLTFMILSWKYILLHSVHYLRTTIIVLVTSTTTVPHHLRTVHLVPCARDSIHPHASHHTWCTNSTDTIITTTHIITSLNRLLSIFNTFSNTMYDHINLIITNITILKWMHFVKNS